MKKLLLVLVVAFSFYACGENKIDVPKNNKKEEQQGNNTNQGNGQNGSEQGNNGGNSNGNNEVVVEFTLADAEKYYEFDKSKVVYYAEQRIKEFNEEKNIGGKTVKVTDVVSINRIDTEGKITYKIKGTINGKAFDKLFESIGFQKKLERHRIAYSLQAKWKNNEDERYKNFDFETLILNKSKDKYTIDYLKEYIEIYATSHEGSVYELTPEDIAKLKISSIELRGSQYDNTLDIKFTYDDMLANNSARLSFDRRKFYSDRLQVNKEFVKNRYMRGVYEHIDMFLGDMISYDINVYEIDRNGETPKSKSDYSNTLNFDFNLRYQQGDVNLVKLTKEVEGFKPLSDLKEELEIYSSHELMEYMKSKLSSNHAEGDVSKKIPDASLWIKKTQLSLKRNGGSQSLHWSKPHSKDASSDIIIGEDTKSMLDVYFERPTFKLVSAVLKDKDLTIKVKLEHVNDTAIEDAYYTFVVSNVK